MSNDHFEHIIKEKLKSYALPVDEGAWNEIEKRLAARAKKKLWLSWIGGAAVAASIALVWLIFPFNKHLIYDETAIQLPDNEKKVTAEILDKKVLLSDELSSLQTQPVQARKNSIGRSGETSVFSPSDIGEEGKDHLPLITETPAQETQPIAKIESMNPEHFSNPEYFSRKEENAALNENEYQQNLSLPHKKQLHKSFGLRAGSGTNLLAMNDGLRFNEENNGGLLRSSIISQNAPSQLENELFTPDDFAQITHYPPLSFGLSVRRGLSNHLSIESGLVYSYLYSKFENKIPQRRASLELHYLGIPLYLVVSPFQGNRSKWEVYASGGFMVEKGLLSHYSQTRYDSNTNMSIDTSSDEKIKGLQWSVNVAIGIDYNIVKNYSLYLEPQVSYYLDNNQPYNIRTVHPLTWGVNGGIRYTW
ncbi:MAG: PorT family protein [Candidatus Azobacteroides sp.]|nr:PorT family protein [Candidatus Azobacteroides sp.]